MNPVCLCHFNQWVLLKHTASCWYNAAEWTAGSVKIALAWTPSRSGGVAGGVQAADGLAQGGGLVPRRVTGFNPIPLYT